MKFSSEVKAAAINDYEMGLDISTIMNKYNVSDGTLYDWTRPIRAARKKAKTSSTATSEVSSHIVNKLFNIPESSETKTKVEYIPDVKRINTDLLPQLEYKDNKICKLRLVRRCNIEHLEYGHTYEAVIEKDKYVYLIKFSYDYTTDKSVEFAFNFGSMLSINNTFEWVKE